MLSSLSRMFQPGPASNPDRTEGLEAGRDVNATTPKANGPNENGLRLNLGLQHSDSAPLLGRYHSSHLSLTDSPRAGPSHVSWKTPTPSQSQSGQESPASSHTVQPMWGTQAMSRAASASSPSLLTTPLSTASASQPFRPASVGKRSSRLSVGFTADGSAHASEDSDGDSVHSTRSLGNVPPGKPLSPIHELHHFPPQRKMSMESGPRTPDSTRTFDRLGGVSPGAHSAFLNRPLKRSTSQTSNSTFRSNISTAAPTIPPLDLRPEFQNASSVPHGPYSPGLLAPPAASTRKSRLLPPPALPTVIGSPVQANKVSVIYEDGGPSARTSSFITAPSLNSPDAETGPPIFVARDYAPSTATDGTDTEETGVTQRASRPLPEGLFDVDLLNAEFGVRPTSRASTRSSPRRSLETRPTYTRSASPASSSESFLQRRWLKGMSFGSDRFVFPPGAHNAKTRASHACILFWVGFVAPWCWLIGGWLLTNAGEVGADGLCAETGPVLPLWHRRARKNSGPPPPKDNAKGNDGKMQDAGLPVPERVKAINGAAERRIKAKSWYPLIAPSLESLTPSTGSGTSTRKLKRCLPSASARGVDPYIQRCRMAAAASGVLIFAAFVVAIVLVAGVRM